MTKGYYQKNRNKILEQTKQRRLENPEKIKEQKRADIEKHGDKRRAKQAEWRALNADRHRESRRKYFQENKELIYEKRKAQKSEYSILKNRAYYAEYREKNRSKISEAQSKYVANNLDRVRESKRTFARTSIQYKIRMRLNNRIKTVVKRVNAKKFDRTMNLLGCNILQFTEYFELLFKPGMTWENYGQFGWHIDHIIPCAAFDLTLESEQCKCFHYTNLQPLWWHENLKKGKKL